LKLNSGLPCDQAVLGFHHSRLEGRGGQLPADRDALNRFAKPPGMVLLAKPGIANHDAADRREARYLPGCIAMCREIRTIFDRESSHKCL
jgi:hypothetical protein